MRSGWTRAALLLLLVGPGRCAATPLPGVSPADWMISTLARQAGLVAALPADCAATEQWVRARTWPQEVQAPLEFVVTRAFSGQAMTAPDMQRALDAAALPVGLNAVDGWSLEARAQQGYASEQLPGLYLHVQLIPGPVGVSATCLTALRRRRE